MKLVVDGLGEAPRACSHRASAAWWKEWCSQAETAGELPQDVDAGPFDFSFEARAVGQDILLEGTLEGTLELECSRCLRRYRHRLRETYRLLLEPAGDRTPPDPEGAEALARTGVWLGEELESGWYRGRELELDAFFAEVLSLAFPVQPICQESCAGLCPQCGINRNEACCECHESKPESAFAVLASLKRSSQD